MFWCLDPAGANLYFTELQFALIFVEILPGVALNYTGFLTDALNIWIPGKIIWYSDRKRIENCITKSVVYRCF